MKMRKTIKGLEEENLNLRIELDIEKRLNECKRDDVIFWFISSCILFITLIGLAIYPGSVQDKFDNYKNNSIDLTGWDLVEQEECWEENGIAYKSYEFDITDEYRHKLSEECILNGYMDEGCGCCVVCPVKVSYKCPVKINKTICKPTSPIKEECLELEWTTKSSYISKEACDVLQSNFLCKQQCTHKRITFEVKR